MRDAVLEVAASTQVLNLRRHSALDGVPNGILLERHFLNLRGLAERCAAETDPPVQGILSELAWIRLVRNCAGSVARWAALLGAQPRLAGALASSLRDLRDAGVAPTELPDSVAELRDLYTRTEAALEELERTAGVFDRIGLFRLAQRGASPWVRRRGIRSASVHGATELVGSAGDLVQSIADVIPLELYQPDPGDPYAAELRETWPWAFRVEPTPVTEDPVVPPDGPVREGALEVLAVDGGPLEELERVAARVLALLEGGDAPDGIAVVARTLEPYASWLPSVFGRYGIPLSLPLSEAALLHPAARNLLDLARILLSDFDAASLVELLRAPRLRWGHGPLEGVPELSERLARAAGMPRGHVAWRSAARRARGLLGAALIRLRPGTDEALLRVLGALRSDAERIRGASSWRDGVGALLDAADRWLPEAGPGPNGANGASRAAEAARSAIRELTLLDAVDAGFGSRRAPSPGELLDAIEEALRSTSIRPHEPEARGVLVLDAIGARGVAAQHLFLIGVNEAFWPRALEEDPFLPDEVRAALRRRLRRPVPVRGATEREERFLFRLLVSQATRSLTLGFHRTDASGRACAPSPYLRELVARTANARDLRRQLYTREALAGPTVSDPTAEPLPLRVARVEAALREGREGLARLARDGTPDDARAIERGLDYVAAIESVSTGDLRFDGVAGPSPSRRERPFRPTRLELLGDCPLRSFFAHVLRVPEWSERSAIELEAIDRGTVVHRVLEKVYQRLHEARLLQPGTRPERARSVALELLTEELEAQELPPTGDASGEVLREGLREQLRRALEAFIAWDLDQLLPEGVSEIHCEEPFEEVCDLGGTRVPLVGKIDRWIRRPGGEVRVSDYKTGRGEDDVRPKEIQAGRALQLPLYVVRVAEQTGAAEVRGEILRVPLRPERRRGRGEDPALPLSNRTVEELRAMIERPVNVLVELERSGRYPFRDGDPCRHCPYTIACRHTHLPSVARVRDAEPFRDYFGISEEST